jgi:hypothetical protein
VTAEILERSQGRNAPEESAFYDASGVCADFAVGQTLKAFEAYDSSGPIEPPSEWPPGEVEQFINASPILPVPARFEPLD